MERSWENIRKSALAKSVKAWVVLSYYTYSTVMAIFASMINCETIEGWLKDEHTTATNPILESRDRLDIDMSLECRGPNYPIAIGLILLYGIGVLSPLTGGLLGLSGFF